MLLQIIIQNSTVTFGCDNLWKCKFMAREMCGKLGELFFLLCGHPAFMHHRYDLMFGLKVYKFFMCLQESPLR